MMGEVDDLDRAATTRHEGGAILAGRYRVVRELGRGGVGVVYLADDTHLEGRRVAIKMLTPVLGRNAKAIEGLKKEALLALGLSHPNIVTLRGIEQAEEGVFLVMDHVEGRTLKELLAERGRLDEAEVLRIFRPIAEALDYAHSRGVIHRDIKPSNILIGADGGTYIMDFGTARQVREAPGGAAQAAGTLAYMSPEQLRGLEPSRAQDIYSLAATMYECFAGRPPFGRGDVEYQILSETPSAEGFAEPARAQALLKALRKSPQERPRSAGELLQAVAGERRPTYAGRPIPIPAAVQDWRSWPKKRARRALVQVIAAGLVLEALVLLVAGVVAAGMDKGQAGGGFMLAVCGVAGGTWAAAALAVAVVRYALERDRDKNRYHLEAARLCADGRDLIGGDHHVRQVGRRGVDRNEVSRVMLALARVSAELGDEATTRSLLERARTCWRSVHAQRILDDLDGRQD